MRTAIVFAAAAAGTALLLYGLHLAWPPLCWIAAGAKLIALASAAAPDTKPMKETEQ